MSSMDLSESANNNEEDVNNQDDVAIDTNSTGDSRMYTRSSTIILQDLKRFAEVINEELATVEIVDAEIDDLYDLKNRFEKESQNAELEAYEEENTQIVDERTEFLRIYRHTRNMLLQRRSELKSTQHNLDTDDIRLPELSIPEFDGNMADWITFRNLYTINIHEKRYKKVKKHSYLMSLLKGNALDLVKNLSISENNYDKCWEIILRHYDDPLKQLSNHLLALQRYPSLENKGTTLRELVGHYQQNYAALQSIIQEHQNDSNFDPVSQILISWFLQKTTLDLRNEWEKELSSNRRFYTFSEFLEFMDGRASANERAASSTSKIIQKRGVTATVMAKPSGNASKYCQYCKKPAGHYIHECEQFLKLQPNARNTFVRKQRICARCLRRKCNTSCSKFTCRICHRQHNTLIHCDRPSSAVNLNEKESSQMDVDDQPKSKTSKINTSESYFPNSFPILVLQTFGALNTLGSLLATATVRIGQIEVKALLDSGSQFNFITEKLQSKLQLPESYTQNHDIQGIGGTYVQKLMSTTSAVINSIHSSFKITLQCLVIDKIVDFIPNNYFSIENWNIPKNIKLADPTFNIPSNIDILIGSNIFWEILGNNKLILHKNLPRLRDTRLGWIISGQINTNTSQGICSLTYNNNLQICNLLEKFWDIENVTIEKRLWTAEERECEQIFLNTTKRLPDGRFIVHLPFKENPNTLGDSRNLALKRFYYLERKLQQNEKLREMYTACLEEYITMDHMREVTVSENQPSYYIPHHAVFKEDSTSTKLRCVFDASMKALTGKSLNDILMAGPVVQSELIAILLRFRTYKYVFTADITKMYRQIRVIQAHTFFQLILWRKSPLETLKTYALQTVTFGVTSSPYQATRCLNKLADDEQEKYPKASPILKKNTYIDDLLAGANTIEEALIIIKQLIELTKSAGFPLCKWSTNHPKLLEIIPETQRELQKVLSLGGETGITTLGTHWLTKEDQIFIKTSKDEGNNIITKRQLLSKISTIYDPLGLIGPVITTAKLLMQLVWTITIDDKKLNWDETLPTNIHLKWNELSSQIPLLKNLRLPRYLFSCNNQILYELHGFADASEEAYGAAIYMRSIDEKGDVNVNILMSKSRVAPLKRQSIPRLELNAALVLSELMDYVHKALYNINISTIRLWSDSEIALYWIHTPSYKLEVYEANRVQKIQNLTKNFHWDHISSKDNPADIISRGLYPEDLLNSTLWWKGPDWLSSYNQAWPKDIKFSPSASSTQLGIRKVKNFIGITITTNPIFSRFSNFSQLIRVIAYMIRFCINARVNRKSLGNGPIITGPLKIFELRNALIVLVKTAQRESFSSEIKALISSNAVSKTSSIKNLNPFLDNQHVLRVGGRLEESLLPHDQKHPMILDRHHTLTKLIIQYNHEKYLHANSHLLSSIIRTQFWIPRLHDAIQLCIRKCVKCIRLKGKTQEQIMANLPKSRIIPDSPFSITGVDYIGPVNIKGCGNKKNRIIFKSYIAIFICFVTKAIHLELIGNLSSQAFISALHRFISRRGKPKEIYSDNGRNFVGAKPILDKNFREFVKENRDKFINFAQSQNIEWHFSPPYAPHWGGLWESNIKCIKRHLRVVTYDSHYNFEEFYTLLTQIEAILNSRPLSPITNNPDDLEILTPAHFLIGRPIIALPEMDYSNKPESRLAYWQQIQKRVQQFWKNWSSTYLHTLQQRNKWQVNSKNLEIGDIVLIKELNQPPLTWPIGRITEVHQGKDNKIRLVSLQTNKGQIQRSISKLIYLPIN